MACWVRLLLRLRPQQLGALPWGASCPPAPPQLPSPSPLQPPCPCPPARPPAADGSLEVVQEGPELAIHQPEDVLAGMNEWCVVQHGKSGLTQVGG